MKKKLFLLALAAVLPLSACGENENDDSNQDNQIQLTALKESYAQFAKLTMGERKGASIQPFLDSGANLVSSKEIDVANVYPYLVSIGEIADEFNAATVLQIINKVGQMSTEGLIDDTVYYFLGFGDGLLKAAAYADGQPDATTIATLAKIDSEVDAIASNVCGIINTALDVVADVTNPSFLLNLMTVVNTNTYAINADALKEAIPGIVAIAQKLLTVKDELNYLVNFVLPIANVLTDIPEVVNIVLEKIKITDFIDIAFDAVSLVVNSLSSLQDEYFEYLKTIENPIEGIAYAVLGLVDEIKHAVLEELTDTKVETAIDYVLSLANTLVTELTKAGVFELPKEVADVLASDAPKALLTATSKLAIDLLDLDLDSADAKALAKILPAIFAANKAPIGISFTGIVDSFENLPEEVIPFVNDKYLVKSEGVQVGADYYFYGLLEDKEHTFATVSINFDGESQYQYGYSFVEFDSLEGIVQPIYDILCEISEEKEQVTGLIKDVYAIYSCGYGILQEIIDLVASSIDIETAFILGIIESVIEENSGELTKILLDAVEVIKDLFSSFVKVGEVDADLDFTDFVYLLSTNTFTANDLLTLHIKESRLEHVDDLLNDIYDLLDTIEMTDFVVEKILELIGLEENPITDKDSFVGFFYGLVKSILVDGEIPAILIPEEKTE